MRLRRLSLLKYGVFEDRTFDFGDGTIDLHLIVGPNEAGKSTLLSGISDLLFNIPERTPYGFRHGMSDLAIAACLALRAQAAETFGRDPDLFEEILVLEYTCGAALGSHRDRPEFEEIGGVSLGAPTTLRLRRRTGELWERAGTGLAPGSAYLLSGPTRTVWEHSIPPQEALRYSITFRTFRTRRLSR